MKQILPYIICLILGIALAQQCNRPEPKPIIRTIEVEVPVIEKQFDTVYINKPVLIHEIDSSYIDRWITAKDSLERLKMYLDAITVREYSQNFTDSIQSIDVWSKTRGELIEQTVSYKTFPRTIKQIDTILPSKGKRSLYALPEVGMNTQMDKVKFSLSLLYKDRNNRIYTIGIDNEAVISLGVGWKLF